SDTASPAVAPAADGGQDTLLLVRASGEGEPADGVTLLAVGSDGKGLVLFVPVGTLVDVPGVGLDRLALAHQSGGAALVAASVENALGVEIGHVAAFDEPGLAALLQRTGGLDVGGEVLDGARLAEYMTARAAGESELATYPHQQQVWETLLEALGDREVADAVTGDGFGQLGTDAPPTAVQEVFFELAAAVAEDAVRFSFLPVEPFGEQDDGSATYRLTSDGVEQLLAGPLAPSVPGGGATGVIKVQVLNGVGTSGIGQAVDVRLGSDGFRTVLTDNARDFDFAQTQILIYEDSERSQAAADRVRDRLGVGTILVSRQPQSLVDLTIVVGADFEPGGAG
ncbi:MAG: LCP family protein, partial [Egibacteraceae bacterium]